MVFVWKHLLPVYLAADSFQRSVCLPSSYGFHLQHKSPPWLSPPFQVSRLSAIIQSINYMMMHFVRF